MKIISFNYTPNLENISHRYETFSEKIENGLQDFLVFKKYHEKYRTKGMGWWIYDYLITDQTANYLKMKYPELVNLVEAFPVDEPNFIGMRQFGFSK